MGNKSYPIQILALAESIMKSIHNGRLSQESQTIQCCSSWEIEANSTMQGSQMPGFCRGHIFDVVILVRCMRRSSQHGGKTSVGCNAGLKRPRSVTSRRVSAFCQSTEHGD
jgi:hypothetical protein